MRTNSALRKIMPLSLFLCLLISCSGCESDLSTGELVLPPDGGEGVTENGAGTTAYFAPFATATLSLINEVRRTGCKCGNQNMPAVSAVQLHAQLNTAAQLHSNDQAANNRMQHEGSDGSEVGARVTRAGFTWRTVGENVAWNYPNVDAVVAGWLASPGHCRNIMNTNFRYMGVGETDLYWTQVFAR